MVVRGEEEREIERTGEDGWGEGADNERKKEKERDRRTQRKR